MRTKLGVAVLAAALVSTAVPGGAHAETRGEPDLRAARATARRLLREAASRPAPRLAATTTQAQVAGAPENVAVGGAVYRAYVSWTPPSGVDGVTGYRVYRGTSATALSAVATTTRTGYLNRALDIGRAYHFAVATITGAGEGLRSAAVAVRIPSRELVASYEGAIQAQASRDAHPVPIHADAHQNSEPAVSPDGRRVAYVSDASGAEGVYVRSADGGGQVRAYGVDDAVPDPHRYVKPSWAPDGSLVAATRFNQHTVDSVLLTADGAYETFSGTSSPSFTPGASVVAVDEDTGGLTEMTFNGTATRRRIPGASSVLDAEVSPDGHTVAFTRIDSLDGDVPLTSVWRVPRYGGTAVRIAAPGGLNAHVTWAPDSRRVYYTHLPRTEAGFQAPRVETVTVDGTGRDRAAAVGSMAASIRVAWPRPRAVSPRSPLHLADFDGNGEADVAVYRPSNGTWYARGMFTVRWGEPGDVPAQADYDGDGKTDLAVFRPSNGGWYVRGRPVVSFGRAGDVPVPADYDGDGRDDIAVFRPSTVTWYVRGQAPVKFGRAGDIPIPGAVTGSYAQPMVVWRKSDSTWYIRHTPDSAPGTRAIQFGNYPDIPVLLDASPGNDPDYAHLGVVTPKGTVHSKSTQLPGYTSQPLVFGLPMQMYGSVPLGLMWRGAPNGSLGSYVLFQPASGVWTGLPGGPFVWGRQGDVAV